MVEHAAFIRGVSLEGRLRTRPVLVAMHDTDFPARFFADLGRSSHERISSTSPAKHSSDGYIHLLQPVQRRVQVAMISLACESVGYPRLDPQRVLGAGIVVRRIPLDERTGVLRQDLTPEAWMQNSDGKFGWTRIKKSEEELDPDPAKRRTLSSGQPELDRMLVAHLGQKTLMESFTPAFVAPPDVCERLKKTIVFAVIPTASSDVADTPPAPPDYSDGSLKQQIPPLLLQGDHRVPYAGQIVTSQYMSIDFCNAHGATDFLIFANLLQVVAIELGAFENTAEGNALLQALNRRSVTFEDESTAKVGDFLAQANQALLQANGTSLQMPVAWDSSSHDDEAAVLAAAQQCLQQRSASLAAPEGRYQDHTRLYRLRIFIRVQCEAGCPPKTLWSDYSDLFEIAPWYESAGLVGPPVPLPRPSLDFLKKARPNVSFVVPDSLMNAIQASTPSSPSAGSGQIGLSWICGFNIPIITICAFFVLNIFLVLLNLVFFWLPFVKICIPIPTAAVRRAGGES
jgi:hypothetical protein